MPSHPLQPPEWIDSAPVLVEQSVEIAASPDEVWTHIADHESWPEWFTALRKVERIGTGEGVGSGRRVTLMGPPVTEEFTAWEPGAHFAFAITSSKLPVLHAMAEEVIVDAPDEGTCRVTYRQGVQMSRGFGWLGPVLQRRLSAQLAAALDALAARV